MIASIAGYPTWFAVLVVAVLVLAGAWLIRHF